MTIEHTERDDDLDARLEHRRREQLSALMDGALAPDQARFLIRRLGHDEALAGRWQRWHLVGDVLRGEAVRRLPGGPGGFSAVVAAAVARDPAGRAAQARWPHGLAAALAASVAAVALFVAWPVATDGDRRAPTRVADAPAFVPDVALPDADPATDALRQVAVPQFADTPVPSATPAHTEPRAARVARATAASGPVPAPVSPAPGTSPDTTLPAAVLVSAEPPFAAPAGPQARPWPRATLPRLAGPARGDLTVDLDDGVPAPSFYPFEPRLPAQDASPGATDAAPDAERRQ